MLDHNNNNNNNTLHIQTRLTAAPLVNGSCSPGARVGAGAGTWGGTWAGTWGGTWAGTWVGVGGDSWRTTGCLLAGDGPSMNRYNNILIQFRKLNKHKQKRN